MWLFDVFAHHHSCHPEPRPQSRVEWISETARSGFGGMFVPNIMRPKVTFAKKGLACTHRANGSIAVCEIHSTALCCAARYDIIKHVRVHTKITKTHRQTPICRLSNFDLLGSLKPQSGCLVCSRTTFFCHPERAKKGESSGSPQRQSSL